MIVPEIAEHQTGFHRCMTEKQFPVKKMCFSETQRQGECCAAFRPVKRRQHFLSGMMIHYSSSVHPEPMSDIRRGGEDNFFRTDFRIVHGQKRKKMQRIVISCGM